MNLTPVFPRIRRRSREIGYRAGGDRLHEMLEGHNRFLVEKALSSRTELPASSRGYGSWKPRMKH